MIRALRNWLADYMGWGIESVRRDREVRRTEDWKRRNRV